MCGKIDHLNGHTLGFHPQTQNLEPPCAARKTAPHLSTSFYLKFSLGGFRHGIKSRNHLLQHNNNNNNNNNNEFLNRMALQYMRTVIKGVL